MTITGDETALAPRPIAPAAPRRGVLARLPVDRSGLAGLAALVLVAGAVLAWPSIISTPTRLSDWAEYACYATIAVGLDLAWGYGGMLALGHGVFFGLGAYAMGMYLSLEQVPKGQLPQFMSLYSDYERLPLLWRPFEHLWFAVAASVLVPMLLAVVIGWPVFRRKVRGPFFALLTQAMALIFVLLVVGQLKLTAGTNGLTNFTEVFGRNPYDPATVRFLFYLAGFTLLAVLVLARHLVRSRWGRLLVATRDAEDRVRFLGYDPTATKTIAFAISAGIAGAAGALAAPIIGLVSPSMFAAVPSIMMIVWVAIGGRGTLYGALVGALVVAWSEDSLSERFPQDWELYQGILFVVVIAFIPGGIAGVVKGVRKVPELLRRRRDPAAALEALEATP